MVLVKVRLSVFDFEKGIVSSDEKEITVKALANEKVFRKDLSILRKAYDVKTTGLVLSLFEDGEETVRRVFLFDQEKNLDLPKEGIVVKNLFLKEHNSENYFLVVTTGDKNADIKSLRRWLGVKPLSFANEEQLEKELGVSRGAVSPMAVINDEKGSVTLIIDDELKGDGTTLLGVHPNENTSTLFITYKELEIFAESCNHRLINMQV